jgi:hypothetical protein
VCNQRSEALGIATPPIVLAALGANDILGARFATGLFRESNLRIRDDQYLIERTAVLAARIETHP